jgi:uncharacterized iron-regulated membrane protein
LGAAPIPAYAARWKTGVVLLCVTGVLFPLTGAALRVAWSLDALLVSRWSMLKAALN